jgi:hypothetical protein
MINIFYFPPLLFLMKGPLYYNRLFSIPPLLMKLSRISIDVIIRVAMILYIGFYEPLRACVKLPE